MSNGLNVQVPAAPPINNALKQQRLDGRQANAPPKALGPSSSAFVQGADIGDGCLRPGPARPGSTDLPFRRSLFRR
jgi:hypothetical protein